MLGVSSAATIGFHFQCSYGCGANPSYSGYPITFPAFGIGTNNWESLLPTPTAYGSCSWTLPGYTTNEIIDTETSTNGLNPLPNGSLSVTWFANAANFDPFYVYAGSPPNYTGGGPLTHPKTGEQEVYATFLRDGVNFGPNGPPGTSSPAPYGSADNPLLAYYSVDVTGLKSLFTNTPFVVELVASGDSIQDLTNAFVSDPSNSIQYSVTYPNTPPVANSGGAPWVRGNGGGLSTGSGVFSNTDHIHIMSNPPQHGGSSPGFDNAGTICGFILTDKPVVSMSPQPIPFSAAGDTIVLSAFAIGVPPLAYQWQFNGKNIPGATTLTNTFPAVLANAGNYTLVVTNLYGAATSYVAAVKVDHLIESPTATNNIVYDSNPDNVQHDGYNLGATWLASSSDSASVTRTGVMSFTALETNGISLADNPAFDGPTGTFTFWMRSAGTDTSSPGSVGATIIERPDLASTSSGLLVLQLDSGAISYITLNGLTEGGGASVSDNKWHFVALTFDQTTNGGTALFQDGTLVATNGNAGTPWTLPAGLPLDFGFDSSGQGYRSYNGLLNDVRFYSSVLSASEISSIQSSGAVADASALQLQFEFAQPPGEGLVISWLNGTAVLQTAPALNGPWTFSLGPLRLTRSFRRPASSFSVTFPPTRRRPGSAIRI